MSFIQNLFTSRDNNANSATYVGQADRLWWDPVTNQFYYSDGNTAGGFPVGGGGGNANPAGSNTQIQFNNNGSFGASVNLTFDNSANTLAVAGAASVTGNVTANYFVGNGSQLTGINGMSSGIQNGNSNVQVYANSNVAISSNGVSNVMVVTSQDVTITGNLTVTGNATLSGNILGDRIQNGNTSFDIQTSNGNANISVGGVSNVAVFTPSGVVVNGNITANAYQGNGTALIGVLSDRGSDTNNWDTLTEMGVYLVNRLSWSGTNGTPLDSQVFVGLLEVQTSQVQTTTQIFYPGQVDATDIKIQWNRALWGSTWTPWVKMTNDGQLISGGEF